MSKKTAIDNPRVIPTDAEIVRQAHYSDLVYGYIHSISEYVEGRREGTIRRVLKKDCGARKIADELNKSYRTISRKINFLKEQGLLRQEGKYYYLQGNFGYYGIIPNTTLKHLIAAKSENLITIYAYLVSLKSRHGARAFYTKSKLLEVLGKVVNVKGCKIEPSKNQYDWDMINNIIADLKSDGLLESIPVEKVTPYRTYVVFEYNISFTSNSMIKAQEERELQEDIIKGVTEEERVEFHKTYLFDDLRNHKLEDDYVIPDELPFTS